VNYYRDFIPQRSHVLLVFLTNLTSPKLPFLWSKTCRVAFKNSNWCLQYLSYSPTQTHRTRRKRLPVGQHHQSTSLSFSSTNRIIKIFLNNSFRFPSNHLLQSKSVLFSTKSHNTRKRATQLVETSVKHRTILYGNKILTVTDHRNLTVDRLSSRRALRWRLLAEKFNIAIIFRQGASNLTADAISCLSLQHTEQSTAIKELETKFYDSYFNNPIL